MTIPEENLQEAIRRKLADVYVRSASLESLLRTKYPDELCSVQRESLSDIVLAVSENPGSLSLQVGLTDCERFIDDPSTEEINRMFYRLIAVVENDPLSSDAFRALGDCFNFACMVEESFQAYERSLDIDFNLASFEGIADLIEDDIRLVTPFELREFIAFGRKTIDRITMAITRLEGANRV